MPSLALAELHGRVVVEEAVAAGAVLAKQLMTTGVHLGHADPTLLRLGSDGLRVLDAQRKALGRRGHLPQVSAASWLSPELVQGLTPDVRTSVFSVGAMVVGLLVGRSPWERENVFETLRAVMQNEWSTPLGQLRSGLPVQLIVLLLSATARAPEQRPSDLQHLGTRLAAFAPEGVERTWEKLVTRLLMPEPSAVEPDSDEVRLVRADELEEQGHDLEARWVRLECHVARSFGPDRAPLQQTLGVLSAELGPERVADLSRAPIDACPMVVGGRCPGRWNALEPLTGVRRTCHECGTSVVHVLDVQRAQEVVSDGGTVAIDVSAERAADDLAIPDEVMMRT
ncbi:MAG: hypothetical protein GQE15_34260 [Archangiaceae bacterium]|nr:hypothetical protein [Archangiaceae bacterium]